MQKTIELLAPGGDVDSIKAAIAAGADAVYCGLHHFNARNRATNIELKDLSGIIHLAHSHRCKVYLTVNIIIIESELRALLKLLNTLVNTGIDGIIVQDLGLFYLLSKHFKTFEIHASTQMCTHNAGQLAFLKRLNASQVNLCRELNLTEIAALTTVAHTQGMKIEVFVHGSYCLSFSGICNMASALEGKSGNRGRCSQPCRDEYLMTPAGKSFPLNLKDNSAYFDLPDIYAAGVDSIKIEGRIKKFHYVYTVVDAWRDQLDRLYQKRKLKDSYGALEKVFNRDFHNGFLRGQLSRDLYIDNPRDNSSNNFQRADGSPIEQNGETFKQEISTLRDQIVVAAQKKIAPLSIEKPSLTIAIAGTLGSPMNVVVKTASGSFSRSSQQPLVDASAYGLSFAQREQADDQPPVKAISAKPLDRALLTKRFKAINDCGFNIQGFDLSGLQEGLFLPSRELTAIRDSIVLRLNGGKKRVEPVSLPKSKQTPTAQAKPTLAVLISSPEQLTACTHQTAEIFFKLPSFFKKDDGELEAIFTNNSQLTPWFPAVLIGKDYTEAIKFLERIKPKQIVTNNSGIAYEACKRGIAWIAGPQLNIVNSYTLLCLKDTFGCSGAFISNELSQRQIADIVQPTDFALHYSIYHPQLLMTSRQCLFHQITGCDKKVMDAACGPSCHKATTITNLKGRTLRIVKDSGEHHKIYDQAHFFNPAIITDLPDRFSSFLIDLSETDHATDRDRDCGKVIDLFADLLNGDDSSLKELTESLPPTTDSQYRKGL
jgi:putative protease